jgi:hypothetical protein
MRKAWPIGAAALTALFLSSSWVAAPAHGQSGELLGPVEAVEVKPHPCRVPGYDQDVLCAAYLVWENRETRRGRKDFSVTCAEDLPPRR